MTTINTLKQQASDLGLTREYVSTFGKLSAKATWQSAIDAHLAATAPSQPVDDVQPRDEPVQPQPLPTPQPRPTNHAEPMLMLLTLVIVITEQLINTITPVITYLYTTTTNHIKHQREIRRRRHQWYAELRQLMTA